MVIKPNARVLLSEWNNMHEVLVTFPGSWDVLLV